MEYFNLAILKLLPPIVQREIALFTGKFWWDHKVHKLRPRWPVRYNKKCVSKIKIILNRILTLKYRQYYIYGDELRRTNETSFRVKILNTTDCKLTYCFTFQYNIHGKIVKSVYKVIDCKFVTDRLYYEKW